MTHTEMIDLIMDTQNNGIRMLVGGNYSGWCAVNTKLSELLLTLKNGITKDDERNRKTIDGLKAKLREAGIEVIEREVDSNGGN